MALLSAMPPRQIFVFAVFFDDGSNFSVRFGSLWNFAESLVMSGEERARFSSS